MRSGTASASNEGWGVEASGQKTSRPKNKSPVSCQITEIASRSNMRKAFETYRKAWGKHRKSLKAIEKHKKDVRKT